MIIDLKTLTKDSFPLTVEQSNTITDKKVLTKYVAAFLLGDGSITTDNKLPNNNKRFICAHTIKNLDYLLWKADILSNISPVKLYYREYERGNDSISLITRSLPFYTTFRERMYMCGVKRPDPHYLKLLDWETMAIWYMDDGCLIHNDHPLKSGDKTRAHLAKLCTNCFSYADHILLARAIKEKLFIEMNIRQQVENGNLHYYFTTPRRFLSKFLDGVRPYILPSFTYKIDISDEGLLCKKEDGDIVSSASNEEDAASAEMTED